MGSRKYHILMPQNSSLGGDSNLLSSIGCRHWQGNCPTPVSLYSVWQCVLWCLFPGALQFVLGLNCLAVCGFGIFFFLGCDNQRIAGATLPYFNRWVLQSASKVVNGSDQPVVAGCLCGFSWFSTLVARGLPSQISQLMKEETLLCAHC